MTATGRFRIVAPLPSPRGHLHVAIDRRSHPPRPVVLAFLPRELSNDPVRLERLSAEVERAAKLFHPNVVAPLGLEAVGDDLAAVTVWRDAVTLRELLDAGGRLPSDIAARIAADVCAGLAHAHGRAEPVVHGRLRPEAVLVDGSGTAAVSGFGTPGGSGASDDLFAVGELLHECLVGSAPEHPHAPLDAPGIPASLAAAVNAARAADPAARFATAEALGEAVARAVPLASRRDVAAYVEAIVPAGAGLRAQRRRRIEAELGGTAPEPPEEISDQDIVCAPTPPPGELAAAEPSFTPPPAEAGGRSTRGAGADPAGGVATATSGSPAAPSASSSPPSTPAPSATSARGSATTCAPALSPDAMPAPSPAPSPIRAPASAPISATTSSTSGAAAIWASISVPSAAATPAGAAWAPSPASPRPTPAGHPGSPAERGTVTTASPVAPPAALATLAGAAATPVAAPAAPAAVLSTPPFGAAPAVPGAGGDLPVRREHRTARGPRVPLWAAIAMSLGGAAIGFALAPLAPWNRSPPAPARPPAEARASAEARAPEASAGAPPLEPAPATRPGSAIPVATAAPAGARPAAGPPPPKRTRSSARQPAVLEDSAESRTGLLDVTAPDGAEIWLDGRRIGTGSTRRRIPEGDHRVEVRHRGAKVGEHFHVAPGETWTYSVTPR